MKRIVKTLCKIIFWAGHKLLDQMFAAISYFLVFYPHTNDFLVILFIAKKNNNCVVINDKFSSNLE